MNNDEIELLSNKDGDKYYVLKNSKLDLSDNDIIYVGKNLISLNSMIFFKNKVLHRLDGPAIEYFNGNKEWIVNGLRHRLDEPAIKYADGSEKWYLNGVLHRENGPAIKSKITEEWYKDGKRHRENGPAIEYRNKTKKWYQNNRLHRLDGPAIIWSNDIEEFWVNGIQISEEKFNFEKEIRSEIREKSKKVIVMKKVKV